MRLRIAIGTMCLLLLYQSGAFAANIYVECDGSLFKLDTDSHRVSGGWLNGSYPYRDSSNSVEWRVEHGRGPGNEPADYRINKLNLEMYEIFHDMSGDGSELAPEIYRCKRVQRQIP